MGSVFHLAGQLPCGGRGGWGEVVGLRSESVLRLDRFRFGLAFTFDGNNLGWILITSIQCKKITFFSLNFGGGGNWFKFIGS